MHKNPCCNLANCPSCQCALYHHISNANIRRYLQMTACACSACSIYCILSCIVLMYVTCCHVMSCQVISFLPCTFWAFPHICLLMFAGGWFLCLWDGVTRACKTCLIGCACGLCPGAHVIRSCDLYNSKVCK